MAEQSSPRSHDRRQQYRDGLPPFSLPPSSGFPLSGADDRSPQASDLHSPSSAYSLSATSSPGFQPAWNSKLSSQHQDSGSQEQYYARKPLPGSPPQSSSPSRFGGQLPPITSLLPPASQYPPSLHPSHYPAHSGPLAPPAGMVAHQHQGYMPQGFGQPPPSLPSIGSSGGPYHEFNVRVGGSVYPVSRESSQQDRPFKCDICTQCFSRNHDLKRHRRIHSATKPFPCPHCDKCFSRKDALKVCLLAVLYLLTKLTKENLPLLQRHRYVKACSGKKSNLGSESSSAIPTGEASTAAEEDEDDDDEQDAPESPSLLPRKSIPSTHSQPQLTMKELKPKEPKVPRSMSSKFTFTRPSPKIIVPALTSTALTLAIPSTQLGKRWIIYTLEEGEASAPEYRPSQDA